jgi:hypothetical protein
MKLLRWSPEKNSKLRAERIISFEDVAVAVENGKLLQIVNHPNLKKYPGQRVMIVEIAGYAYLIPYVEEESHYFLKTIIPSRKATRNFILKGAKNVNP